MPPVVCRMFSVFLTAIKRTIKDYKRSKKMEDFNPGTKNQTRKHTETKD